MQTWRETGYGVEASRLPKEVYDYLDNGEAFLNWPLHIGIVSTVCVMPDSGETTIGIPDMCISMVATDEYDAHHICVMRYDKKTADAIIAMDIETMLRTLSDDATKGTALAQKYHNEIHDIVKNNANKYDYEISG
jgi:hypothetical protein